MAALGVRASLEAALACIVEELDPKPCEIGVTVGTPLVSSCCECDDGQSGELWANMTRIFPGAVNTGNDRSRGKPCAPVWWFVQFQVRLFRCFPTLDESGNLPEVAEFSDAADGLHKDATSLVRALHCCKTTGEAFIVENVTMESDPSGGCAFVTATVRTMVNLRDSLVPTIPDGEVP